MKSFVEQIKSTLPYKIEDLSEDGLYWYERFISDLEYEHFGIYLPEGHVSAVDPRSDLDLAFFYHRESGVFWPAIRIGRHQILATLLYRLYRLNDDEFVEDMFDKDYGHYADKFIEAHLGFYNSNVGRDVVTISKTFKFNEIEDIKFRSLYGRLDKI